MKQLQKIIGIILFVTIGIIGILMTINAYIDIKYIIEPYGIECIDERAGLYISALSNLMWLIYFMTLALFICLWRKGSKR